MTHDDAKDCISRGIEAVTLLTARQCAARLQISERSVWAISAPRGALRCVRIGKLCRYDPADVTLFIEQSKGASQ
jgi:predicted DNA-binding transcriptional regulator AlpA